MSIAPRAEIRFAVIRARRLGATEQEAFATVAQAFNLSVETVEECWREIFEEVCA